MKVFWILFVAVITLALSSCTLEKRLYRSGFYSSIGKTVQRTPFKEVIAEEYENPPGDTLVNEVALTNNRQVLEAFPDSILQDKHNAQLPQEVFVETKDSASMSSVQKVSDTGIYEEEDEGVDIALFWEIMLAFSIIVITLVLVGLLVGDGGFFFTGLIIGAALAIIIASVVIIKLLRKGENQKSIYKSDASNSLRVALILAFLGLAFIGSLFLLCNTYITLALIFVGIGIVLSLISGTIVALKFPPVPKKGGTKESSEKKAKPSYSRSYILYGLASLILFACAGILLFSNVLPVGFILISMVLSIIAALISLMQIQQMKKRKIERMENFSERQILHIFILKVLDWILIGVTFIIGAISAVYLYFFMRYGF